MNWNRFCHLAKACLYLASVSFIIWHEGTQPGVDNMFLDRLEILCALLLLADLGTLYFYWGNRQPLHWPLWWVGGAFFLLFLLLHYHPLLFFCLAYYTLQAGVKFFERVSRCVADPAKVMIVGFVFMSLLGGLALSLLPNAQRKPISVLDGIFTATSSCCVTGLAVFSPGQTLTSLGQTIMILLIQFGGLGIMVLGGIFLLVMGNQISFRNQALMSEALTVQGVIAWRRILFVVLGSTFLIEGLGTLILWALLPPLPGATPFFNALFHAISAFCNAGFSLFPDNLAAVGGREDILVTIALLIFLGGIGFPVLAEIGRKLFGPGHRFSVHARLALYTSLFLIVGGTLVLGLTQTLETARPPEHRWLASFFHSVSSRTAGFNSDDLSRWSAPSQIFLLFLMVVGGSPMSCAGGLKTVTFAILLFILLCRLQRRDNLEIGRRTIPARIVTYTVVVLTFYLGTLFLGTWFLTMTEPTAAGVLPLVFEATSALGTVGLSLGVTATLTPGGKIILILLMLIGRLGPLILLSILPAQKTAPHYRYPDEDQLIVG